MPNKSRYRRLRKRQKFRPHEQRNPVSKNTSRPKQNKSDAKIKSQGKKSRFDEPTEFEGIPLPKLEVLIEEMPDLSKKLPKNEEIVHLPRKTPECRRSSRVLSPINYNVS